MRKIGVFVCHCGTNIAGTVDVKAVADALGKEAASNAEVKTTLEAEKGCPFAYRCPHAEKACCEALPELTETESGHRVRCLLVQ